MSDDNQGGVSDREHFDVVAYVLERNAFPAGDLEFGSDPTELGEVFIEEGQPEQGRAIWQAPRERQAVG